MTDERAPVLEVLGIDHVQLAMPVGGEARAPSSTR